MIRKCTKKDIDKIYEIINDAAGAYKGVIPEDCYHKPYMPKSELEDEIKHGVVFWGYEHHGELVGIMGHQDVENVALIRHAYVRTDFRNQGIGSKLLYYLRHQTNKPILVGTWRDAKWAISFYEKHGFLLIPSLEEKDMLLGKYWAIPKRQIETSVVLADKKWLNWHDKDKI